MSNCEFFNDSFYSQKNLQKLMISYKDVKKKIKTHFDLINASSKYGNILNEIVDEYNSYNYLKNYIDKYSNKEINSNMPKVHSNIIWQFWNQGLEKAPILVRECLNSVEKNISSESKVILLDEKNLNNYINIEGFIYDKKRKGIISNVNYSDIIRSYLLAEHGGTWIDATVYLTGNISEYVGRNNLFFFSVTPFDNLGYSKILGSSWFLYVPKGSGIFEIQKKIISEFWKFENNCKHKYYFHLFLMHSIFYSKDNFLDFETMPFVSNIPPHYLQMELFNQFNAERFKQIVRATNVHKLSHYGRNFNIDKDNTYYKFIINSLNYV